MPYIVWYKPGTCLLSPSISPPSPYAGMCPASREEAGKYLNKLNFNLVEEQGAKY